MSQFRQNPISKEWVLIAPNRSSRPDEFASLRTLNPENLPEKDPACPLCPGNEAIAGVELARIPNSKHWEIHVILNKFEALAHIPLTTKREFYVHRAGAGDHEVIITRKHNEPVALQPVQTIALTFQVLRQRLLDLNQQQYLAYSHIFHNYGHQAGASITHPHYQILSTPMVPTHVHAEIQGATNHRRLSGTNIYDDIIGQERIQEERVVLETDRFIVIAPYASRHPFELMILPKYHAPKFEETSDGDIKEFAYVLKAMLGNMYVRLNNPALNFYMHTMPFERTKLLAHDQNAYRWHITLFPRIWTWAGFEFGTGIPVNPITPEDTAKLLR